VKTHFEAIVGLHHIPLSYLAAFMALGMTLSLALLSCGDGKRSPTEIARQPSAAAVITATQSDTNPSTTPPLILDTTTPTPSRTVTPMSSTQTATYTPTCTEWPTAAPSLQRTQYDLSARLDYERHHLVVSQTVAYVNNSSERLIDLLFVVEPNRQPAAFHMHRANWADGQAVADYTLDGARLHVPLREPLMPGAHVGLRLSFELDVPPDSDPFGYTSRQTNLGDWYPYVPPYRAGQGWAIHEPALVGEHQVYDVADFQVEIELVGPERELVVVASGLIEADAGRYFHELDDARSFAWSVSPEYVMLTDAVGPVTVQSYVFPEHVVAGRAALRATADALALYSELFGPYPHSYLVLIEALFPDGMEYDGLFFLGSEYYAGYAGHPRGYLTPIAVHETAHQWWYGRIGNDQALEPWLDEALATYSELLFYERMYPELVDWWWEFRVTRFHPEGWVNSTIYEHGGFRPYVDAVYLRGALFMQNLRDLVGDEAFLAFLQDYAQRSAQLQVMGEDFFSILAEHSAADIRELVLRYFEPQE
jgi:hypothetical protein